MPLWPVFLPLCLCPYGCMHHKKLDFLATEWQAEIICADLLWVGYNFNSATRCQVWWLKRKSFLRRKLFYMEGGQNKCINYKKRRPWFNLVSSKVFSFKNPEDYRILPHYHKRLRRQKCKRIEMSRKILTRSISISPNSPGELKKCLSLNKLEELK